MKHTTSKYLLSLFSSVCLICSVSAEETEPPAIMSAGFSSETPVMDGDIRNDPVWQKVPWNERAFRVFRQREMPAAPTRIKALYTENALYLALECQEKEMDRMEAEQNAYEFWRYDIIELFFYARPDEVLHLAVSAAGSMNEEIPSETALRTKYKTAWLAKAKKYKDMWTTEICIPIYLLGIQAGGKKYDLPFSVCRFATPSKQYSTWVDVAPGQQLKSVENFGRISFVPAPEKALPAIRAAAEIPHPLSLYQRWNEIRTDTTWAEILTGKPDMVKELNDLYDKNLFSGPEIIRFAELLAELEKKNETIQKADRQRIMNRLFAE